MSFHLRAAVALLSGIGGGTLGFWGGWKVFSDAMYANPAAGYSHWLAATIFTSGIVTCVTVFLLLSRSSERLLAAAGVPVRR
jgi:hypothetical protein